MMLKEGFNQTKSRPPPRQIPTNTQIDTSKGLFSPARKTLSKQIRLAMRVLNTKGLQVDDKILDWTQLVNSMIYTIEIPDQI